MEVFTLSENIFANVHAPLFEWVIENLSKNAVDAMGNTGTIAIKILRGNEGKVFIDISDTGKGFRVQDRHVFGGFYYQKKGLGSRPHAGQTNYRNVPRRKNLRKVF
jgi:K+-sensing histidine kinase KdpD